MRFSEYQAQTNQTAIYRENCTNHLTQLSYLLMGLTEEAGETAGKMKKFLRDEAGAKILAMPPSTRSSDEAKAFYDFTLRMEKELGDVLWYAAQIADTLGLSLSSVAEQNLEKLFGRKARGVLGGSGDER